MIHVVIVPVDQLGHRHKLIAGFFQCPDQNVQRLGSVSCPIVAQYDGTVSEMFILCDCLYNRVRTIIFPVETVDIPLDRIVIAFSCNFHKSRVIIAVWRAEQKHIIPGELLDLIVHRHEFLFLLGVGQLAHILVILAVVSKVMTFREYHLYIFRVGLHPHKWAYRKRDFYLFYHILQIHIPYFSRNQDRHPVFFHKL